MTEANGLRSKKVLEKEEGKGLNGPHTGGGIRRGISGKKVARKDRKEKGW